MFLDPLGLVERGQRKIGLARFVGKTAVDRAIVQLRDRLASAEREPVPVIEAIALSTAEDAAPPVPQADADQGEAPERADLVLPDYDHLPAAHVVAKLVSLTPKERAAIERYELAHRHRRTILGKIDQLRES